MQIDNYLNHITITIDTLIQHRRFSQKDIIEEQFMNYSKT